MYSSQTRQLAFYLKVLFVATLLVTMTSSLQAKANTQIYQNSYAASIDATVKSDVIIEKPRFLTIIQTNERIFHNDKDIFCMAKNIYHEAGGESLLGKYAVAQVTLNRVRNPFYPKNICDVVFDPNQFSWVNADDVVRLNAPYGRNWEESKKVALDVIVGGKRIHGLEKALFFHNLTVNPIWATAQRKLVKIGGHIFYRR
jgi:N-acetylmuramoyl-L-alanine amidase